MVFSYIKLEPKAILFYASSASYRAERVSLSPPILGLRQNLTRKFKPQSLLLSRTSLTRFDVVSIATVASGAARRLSCSRGGLAQATRRSYQDDLDELACLAVLMDKDDINAFCGPNGIIVIYSGLLKHLKSDEEIATVIAHEMGHAVARHVAEKMVRVVVLLIPTIWDIQSGKSHTAGYDPQVAPSVYENRLGGGDSFESLSTHPRGKKESQPKTMKLAKQVYEDVKAGNQITSFV
ncbi:Peptidase M48 [Corchorus olitorius]|uniref:Peptidase M48 n=1 Tax=Corchorus olitorius TaxID=93759 RepID=A0A1R3KRT3_9ROSI|nr:Peptidase M48 [Corchorus olitorius]